MRFMQTRVDGPRVTGFPLSGPITSRFGAVGDARLADGTVLHTSGHTGCDIGGPTGTEAHAPAPGRVCDTFSLGIQSTASWIAEWKRIFGNSVILEHPDGHYTLYAHLSAIKVREGMSVVTGDVLGLVGSTGLSTGPHLHWGMGAPGNRYLQRDKGLLNPLDFVGPDPIPAGVKLSPPLDPTEPTGKVWNALYDAVADGHVIDGVEYHGTEGTYKPLPQTHPGKGRYEFEINL